MGAPSMGAPDRWIAAVVTSKLNVEVETPVSDDDRDILAGISVMVLATANRQNLADHELHDDEAEGMKPAPCGSQNPDDPDRYCISEVGHKGHHKHRHINGLVN